MEFELFFICSILLVALIAFFMGMEHSFKARFLQKRSFLRRQANRFAQRFPRFCEGDDSFYCFFRRDSFHRN